MKIKGNVWKGWGRGSVLGSGRRERPCGDPRNDSVLELQVGLFSFGACVDTFLQHALSTLTLVSLFLPLSCFIRLSPFLPYFSKWPFLGKCVGFELSGPSVENCQRQRWGKRGLLFGIRHNCSVWTGAHLHSDVVCSHFLRSGAVISRAAVFYFSFLF